MILYNCYTRDNKNINHCINNNDLLRAVGVEFDAQVSAAHTFGEEKQRIGHRTFHHGLGS